MIYDIIIVGGGPAGLTAAVYALRANKTVLVLEKGTFGGQITSSPKVENIPGFSSVTGNEFAEKLIEQAMNLGAEIECCEALQIKDGDLKTVLTDEGEFCAKAVIIATGTKHRLLGIEREEEFIGNGISFCAVCDGAFYTGQDVAMVGGGNSALQEALLLSEMCRKVTVVQNLNHFTGEKKLADALMAKENVEIKFSTLVTEYLTDDASGALCGLRLRNAETGEESEIKVDGAFLAVGLVPENDAFAEIAALNDWGYFDSSEDCLTITPGVFVAGDCRSKRIRQVVTASSDGAIAATAACAYLDEIG